MLVRKSIHQLNEYNHESNNMYLEPVSALASATANWSSLTSGLDEEQLADMEQARAKLENY